MVAYLRTTGIMLAFTQLFGCSITHRPPASVPPVTTVQAFREPPLDEQILEKSRAAFELAQAINDGRLTRPLVQNEANNLFVTVQTLVTKNQDLYPANSEDLSEEISETLLDIKYLLNENTPYSLRLARHDPNFQRALLSSLLDARQPFFEGAVDTAQDSNDELDGDSDVLLEKPTLPVPARPRLSSWIDHGMADRIIIFRYKSLIKDRNSVREKEKKVGRLARKYIRVLASDQFVKQCQSDLTKYHWVNMTPNDCKIINGYAEPHTKISFINRKKQNGATIYHEALHLYSNEDFLALPHGFVEGVTEYLTRVEARRRRIGRKSIYEDGQAIAAALVSVIGTRKAINEAVFSGQVSGFRVSVDTKLGPGTFDNLLKQMDTSLCNERSNCSRAKIYLDSVIRTYRTVHPELTS